MKKESSDKQIRPYQAYLDGTAGILRESQKETKPYTVEVMGKSFIVLPGVFSPKYFFDTEFFVREIAVQPGEDFLEIGSGTGVISVMAALRGAGHVSAVDINPAAVENTKCNVLRHGVTDRVTVFEGNLYEPLPKGATFDTIFWNIPFGRVEESVQVTMLERAVFDPAYTATKQFILDAPLYIKPQGRLLIGFSKTLGKVDVIESFVKEAGFNSFCEIAQLFSTEAFPVTFELFEARVK